MKQIKLLFLGLALAPVFVAKAEIPSGHELWSRSITPFKGVEIKAQALETPHTLKVYIAKIDLTQPNIGFTATERDPHWGEPMPDYTNRTVLIDTRREKTADFMTRKRAEGKPVCVAVNASPWYPWDCPMAYHSKYGAFRWWQVSDGTEISNGKDPANGPFFVIWKQGGAEIVKSVQRAQTNDAAFAMRGFGYVMTNGVPAFTQKENRDLVPKTAFGLTPDRKSLVLLVVDGRQPEYSKGADRRILFDIFRKEGVSDAVDMDGGGSSSLVIYDEKTQKPWHLNHQPRGQERRNALNFGIFFKQ